MVWNRTHVEALSPHDTPWEAVTVEGIPDGLTARLLSIDEGDGALTAELRIPAGWEFNENWSLETDLDFYVVRGELRVGETGLVRNDFSSRPAGYVNGPIVAVSDSMILVFAQGTPKVSVHDRAGSSQLDRAYRDVILKLPAMDVPAKPPLTDREVKPNIFSRTLKLNPITGERFFITGSSPASNDEQRGDPRIEWHECVEEIYALDNWVSMDAPNDTLRLDPGWYCFRPPGIPHGPFRAGEATELATLFRVSSTLTNNYVDMDESKQLWTDYPAESLFPGVRARIGDDFKGVNPNLGCAG